MIAPDQQIVAGLDGVLACESAVTLVDGEAGELFFRGYDVSDFAEQGDYLSVVHLLWYGRWPTPSEQVAFDQDTRARRGLPEELYPILRLVPDHIANPMAALRTAVSLLGALDPRGDAVAHMHFELADRVQLLVDRKRSVCVRAMTRAPHAEPNGDRDGPETCGAAADDRPA